MSSMKDQKIGLLRVNPESSNSWCVVAPVYTPVLVNTVGETSTAYKNTCETLSPQAPSCVLGTQVSVCPV